MRALLINIDDHSKSSIDALMTIFSSSIRYSFDRLLEGVKISELEKEICTKYALNIRQSKDAVESARQTIASQKALVKMYVEDYTSKIKAIDKQLKKTTLPIKKRKKLLMKLEKRQRKLDYYTKFIETDTIPKVIFGGKKNFIKRCKGTISNEEWKYIRDSHYYSRGDKSKNGNPHLRVVIEDKMSYLEISTLELKSNGRAIKIKVPLYLPQKISKKCGKENGINYRGMFLEHLESGKAYQVELVRREGKYYCHITFDMIGNPLTYTNHRGVIGVDTNPDGFALTHIDNKGNYLSHSYLKEHELVYARSDRRSNLCGELVAKLIRIAKEKECGIAVEDLKFRKDKDVSSKFNRITHQFCYSQLLTMLESACYKEGVELVKVKPQYTSKIGLYKYCHQYGMDVHNGASMVIGRRSYGYSEKVPKVLKDRIVKDIDLFNAKTEWGKWSEIGKSIKKKDVETPGKWLRYRKTVLGIN